MAHQAQAEVDTKASPLPTPVAGQCNQPTSTDKGQAEVVQEEEEARESYSFPARDRYSIVSAQRAMTVVSSLQFVCDPSRPCRSVLPGAQLSVLSRFVKGTAFAGLALFVSNLYKTKSPRLVVAAAAAGVISLSMLIIT